MILVDPEHQWIVDSHSWRESNHGYAVRTASVNGKRSFQLRLHREVWKAVHGKYPKLDIDHINENKLDNRTENLRLASRSLNVTNSSRRRKASAFPRGVVRTTEGRFKAQVMRRGKNYNLGHFQTVSEAAAAYQNAKEVIIEFEALLSAG